ncbi:putative pectinesterase/pectinesterase inhibitor 41 [Prunus yedoensis var. nudiflora]|uniref:pectinesterase n=1 Tax=Prunus yedoensis var. nudiflora TaxID=2094558 RepID=A0A314YAK8_PRUYE|nr:putative pectinesterase/pectinesterase inhibitor 41 [Prunus yedoensis var. nudiflora]
MENLQAFSVFKVSIFVLVFSICFASPSLAADATPVSKEAICKFTPDPSFCNYVLPNQTSNVYEFWRYAAQKSLSQSRKFLNLVDKYLKLHSTLSKTAVLALQDCQFLAGLNIDFLSSSLETLNTTKYQTLSSLKTDDVQTLLSAILTNQQTCLDGIQATASSWSVKRSLSVPLSNDTSLYSVSLALFTKSWVPKTKKKGRKLLDETDQQIIDTNDVLVRDKVTAGVYEEYVTIDKKKKYLMMIGDGINQTVVTGNRSVKGGNWTTFRSATFAVVGQGFVAVNMTFRNTAGAENGQAVAVRNGADLSTFYSLIDEEGWHEWDGNFALKTLDYEEYDNTGPGSETTGRVSWDGYHVIKASDASNFTVSNFLLGDDWLTQTGVPFSGGLY